MQNAEIGYLKFEDKSIYKFKKYSIPEAIPAGVTKGIETLTTT